MASCAVIMPTKMIAVKDTLVSDEVLAKKFVCDLGACKGACCVEGEAGAPLDESETLILEEIYEQVKPFMNPIGIKTIEKKGKFVKNIANEFETPLNTKNKHCAYVVFDENNLPAGRQGIAKCAIEMANRAGKIDFKKPVSCHLYPIRISDMKSYLALNYEKWSVCKPAGPCGEKLNVPVYKFLKEPLIRRFGKDWYNELELIAAKWAKK